MAQLSNNEKRNVSKPDMTPLVDLGFLLITFFIYTTTFTKPVQMPFAQPKSDEGTSIIKESNSLTLILGANNQLFYHNKNLIELTEISLVGNSKTDLQDLLINSKRNAKSAEKFTVIIKPSEFSTYNNFVDILDEIVIVNQQIYAVVDISAKEKVLLL